MSQSKRRSTREVGLNMVIGYILNYGINLLYFLWRGPEASPQRLAELGVVHIVCSTLRLYVIRRWFAKND